MVKKAKFSIFGAGAWGTALALQLARAEIPVCLWGHDAAQQESHQQARENTRYLPGLVFPSQVNLTADLASAARFSNDWLIVVPSHAFRSIVQQLLPYLAAETRLVWATKGIEAQTNLLLHEVVKQVWGDQVPMAFLSGPSFALEVAKGLPTAVCVGATDNAFAQDVIGAFHHHQFRVYQNDDLIGMELCSALKNVLAIAAGIADGMQLGHNTQAALITRGLAEMDRFCCALGGSSNTVTGLAGLGDLLLTAGSDLSRNQRFGQFIGKGSSVEEAKAAVRQVVEGYDNTQQVYQLSKQHQIEMPISDVVFQVLFKQLQPKQALTSLLNRPQGWEF